MNEIYCIRLILFTRENVHEVIEIHSKILDASQLAL